MKIYVAAPWKNKDDARKVAEQLTAAGLGVRSRWHDTDFRADIYEAPEDIMKSEALKDLADIGDSDTMLYLNMGMSEGKATELGMALIRAIPIYVVGGKQNNVFLHLPQVNHVASVEEFIKHVSRPNEAV